ncbi:MAG: hypothetical protein EA001_01650 [Oscillatoriales cyanobacterium]|nr:MAG: hypothetical protein EA001_01650 [Oscillatoriales cyanobacterium]
MVAWFRRDFASNPLTGLFLTPKSQSPPAQSLVGIFGWGWSVGYGPQESISLIDQRNRLTRFTRPR